MAANRTEQLTILGLKEDATEDEIKRAYKDQARKCHPDKNLDDPNATLKFQQLSEAYTYLTGKNNNEEEYDNSGDPELFDLLVFFAHMRNRYAFSETCHHGFCRCDDPYIDPYFADYRSDPTLSRRQRQNLEREQFMYDESSYDLSLPNPLKLGVKSRMKM